MTVRVIFILGSMIVGLFGIITTAVLAILAESYYYGHNLRIAGRDYSPTMINFLHKTQCTMRSFSLSCCVCMITICIMQENYNWKSLYHLGGFIVLVIWSLCIMYKTINKKLYHNFYMPGDMNAEYMNAYTKAEAVSKLASNVSSILYILLVLWFAGEGILKLWF